MKKALLFLCAISLAAASVSAQEGLFSIGAGITGSGTWAINTTNYKNDQVTNDALADEANFKYKKQSSTNGAVDFGGFLFFDATYAEFDVTLGGGKAYALSVGSSGAYPEQVDAFKLGLALFGKYPFAIGDSGLTIAPLLGVQADLVLAATTQYGNTVAAGDKNKYTGVLLYDGKENGMPKIKNGTPFDLSTIALKLGAEAKYPLSEKLYLDAQWLWGITFDSAVITSYKSFTSDFASSMGIDSVEIFMHGTTFKLGVGYRL